MIHQEFRRQLRQLQSSMCPDQRTAVMITNITPENLEGEHFCVLLDPAYLMYAKRDTLSSTILRYDFDPHLLTLNGTPIPISKLPDLMSKVTHAIHAAQDKRARVYAKPSSLTSLVPVPVAGGRHV